MGCQKDIARAIHAQGGDYVLRLRGHQGLLHDDVKTFFEDAQAHHFDGVPHSTAETVDADHGRLEVRRAWATEDLAWLADRDHWPGVRSLVLVESERTLREQTTRDRRLCLSSLPADAARLARVVRSHWAIENGLHWVLDVAMNQDRTRIRKDHAPDNLAVLHHIALNLLKQERTAQLGIKNKRLAAGGDEDYVLRVLTASDI